MDLQEEQRRAIGLRLKESRQAVALTQEVVARALKVKRQQVSKWERGEGLPSTDQWYALGTMYAASLDYLVYGVRTIPLQLHAIMQSAKAAA